MSLYEYMGFTEDPFAVKAAENEKNYLSKIFIKPSYFNSVIESTLNGKSRFVIGQRGHGKTAIIQQIEKELESTVFYVKINSFDDVSISQNEKEFLHLFLTQITNKFAFRILKEPSVLKRLDNSEKDILKIVYKYYYNTLSRNDFLNCSDTLIPFKSRNRIYKIWNHIASFFSYSGKIIQAYPFLLIDMLINDPNLTINKIEKLPNLVKEIQLHEPIRENIKKSELWSYSTQKELLISFAKCIKKVGYNRVVIILDQIDEHVPLDGQTTKIVEFTKNIFKDNSLINNDEVTFVVSLWSKLKDKLAVEGVRFDKIEEIELNWKDPKLLEMLNRRISFFSVLNSDLKINQFIENTHHVDSIIKLSNGNPRDLFGILASIYREQSEISQDSNVFSIEAINRGINSFISNYNYLAHGTSESKKEISDIKYYINCILKTSQIQFDLQNLVSNTNINNVNKANDVCKLLISYNILEELDTGEGNGHRMFKVIDPKIEYFIKTGRKSLT